MVLIKRGWAGAAGPRCSSISSTGRSSPGTPSGWATGRFFGKTTTCCFSHAGFAEVADPLDPLSSDGVLWRRGPLRNTGQLQVVGHTPTKSHRPERDEASNTIYLDTGAADGHFLTGLRLSETGAVLETVAVRTAPEDISRAR